jgi:hypothetical protein
MGTSCGAELRAHVVPAEDAGTHAMTAFHVASRGRDTP